MARPNNKEEHHMIPLSCAGPNWKENCTVLTQHEHKLLHETLDIPYGLLRRFRKRVNHLIYMDTYYVEQLELLHKLYFARLPQLPEKIQRAHLECMIAVSKRAQRDYQVTNVFNVKHGTTHQMFVDHLNNYHTVLFERAKKMEEVLPKQIHP